jgi:hypothetical protein
MSSRFCESAQEFFERKTSWDTIFKDEVMGMLCSTSVVDDTLR